MVNGVKSAHCKCVVYDYVGSIPTLPTKNKKFFLLFILFHIIFAVQMSINVNIARMINKGDKTLQGCIV